MNSLMPFRNASLDCINEEFNRIFDKFFSTDSLHAARSKYRSGYPKLDVIETDREYVVEAEVPGVDVNELLVEVVPLDDSQSTFGISPPPQRILRLSGKKDEDFQYPDCTVFHVKELRRSQFVREILLPEYVQDDPKATYEKGILKLTFRKPEPAVRLVPKQIPITKIEV